MAVVFAVKKEFQLTPRAKPSKMKKVLSNAFYAVSLAMLSNLLESCGGMNYAGPPKAPVVAGNDLIYSASDGNPSLAMKSQAWILKIDYADGAGHWQSALAFGNGGDFGPSRGDPYNSFISSVSPF